MQKISTTMLRRIISEEIESIIDKDRPEEVEAIEDAWAGGDNLEHDINHPEAAGAEENIVSIEILSIVDDAGVYRMSEAGLRSLLRNIIIKS